MSMLKESGTGQTDYGLSFSLNYGFGSLLNSSCAEKGPTIYG
jgi:hypothetical protein